MTKPAKADAHQTTISLVQAFAKKAGWAAEDLRSAPAELKENVRDTARDDSSPLHKEFPTTALRVGCLALALMLTHKDFDSCHVC